MMLKIILFAILTQVSATPWEVVQIKNTEVVFEKLGVTLEYKDEITIFSKITISSEEEIGDFIFKLENKLNNTCNTVFNHKNSRNCKLWGNEITFWKTRITKIVQGLNHYFRRQKRGAIDIIGSLSKGLFGIMDQNDSDRIYKTLDKLQKDGGAMVELLDKQTAVVAANFEIVKMITGNLTEQAWQLENKLDKLSSSVQNNLAIVRTENTELWSELEVNRIVIFALAELERLYDYLLEQETLITTLQQHRIHPLLIDSEYLTTLIKNLTNGIGHEMLYSAEIINQLAKVNIEYASGDLGVRIQIQILQKDEYTLYKIYPIPRLHERKLIIMIPEWDYMANSSAGHFVHYTNEEFNSACREISTKNNNNLRICKQTQPKIIELTPPQCLINHFLEEQSKKVDHLCHYRTLTEMGNNISPMKTKNTWLFMFPHKKTLVVLCATQVHKLVLEKTGILTLKEKCVFLIDHLELPFKNTKEQVINNTDPFHFLKWSDLQIDENRTWTNFTKLSVTNSAIKLMNPETLSKEFSKRRQSLAEISDEIKKAKKNQADVSTYQMITTSNSAGLILIAAILIIYSIVKIYKKWKPKEKKT